MDQISGGRATEANAPRPRSGPTREPSSGRWHILGKKRRESVAAPRSRTSCHLEARSRAMHQSRLPLVHPPASLATAAGGYGGRRWLGNDWTVFTNARCGTRIPNRLIRTPILSCIYGFLTNRNPVSPCDIPRGRKPLNAERHPEELVDTAPPLWTFSGRSPPGPWGSSVGLML